MTASSLLGPVGMLAVATMIGGARYLVMTGVMVVVMLGAGVTAGVRRSRSDRRRSREARNRHEQHLAGVEASLIEAESGQRRRAIEAEPGPEHLQQIVDQRVRVWERLPHHPDFTTVRLGTGSVMPDLAPVSRRSGDVAPGEPDLLERAGRLEDRWRHVEEMPVTVDLDGVGCLAIVGSTASGVEVAGAILSRMSVFRSPADLCISFHLRDETTRWDWAKWLPHTRMSPATWMTVGPEQLFRYLSDGPPASNDVMVIDPYRPGDRWGRLVESLLDDGSGALTIVMVDRAEDVPTRAGATLVVDRDTATYTGIDGPRERICDFSPDRLDPAAAEAIARSLAPLSLGQTAQSAHPTSLGELIGVIPTDEGVHRHRASSRPLCTAIGLGPTGTPTLLDLREAAAGGMGPHGMLIGATGSGKSELLKTLVLGLALGDPPEELSFVFIDFKGGATFRDLERLPHRAGTITNLESAPLLVERMRDSLTFEMTRRQRLLANAGVDRADQYRDLSPASLDPLPALVIIVDEFGELISAHPGLLDMFTSIARTGRSVGMHLLVSGQRIDEGRLRRLDGHLRYRICLKTFTPEESIAVIGSRASFDLPSEPGHGHLLLAGEPVRFRAVSASEPLDSVDADGETRGFVDFGAGEAEPESSRAVDAETLVDLLARLDQPARRVWMDPLPQQLPMSDDRRPDLLRAVFGVTDRPAIQEQAAAEIDFSSESGHLAVVGMPRSGKSSMLATLITSLAISRSPEDIEIHVIDLGGGSLHRLADLPQVGSVFGRADADGIERLLDHLTGTIDRRAAMSDVGRRRAMFLFVDGWPALVREHGERCAETVRSIVIDGSRHDVHVVISATRWGDVGSSLRGAITGRFELRLTEPLESEIDRRAAASLPRGVPGRGIDAAGEVTQVALPLADRSDICRRWLGSTPVEPIRVLPRSIDPRDVDPGTLGVRAPDMTAWSPDLFGRHPHLLILGDGGTGKTTALRGVLSSISVPARIAVIGSHTSLNVSPADPTLIGMAASLREAGSLVQAIIAEAANPDSLPIVLAVDDYHLVSGSADAPLEQVASLIQAGPGTGVHLVLTRRVAGLNRAAFDPMLRRLRDCSAAILLLSADPGEGRLWGTIDTALRPPGRALLVEDRTQSTIQIADFQMDAMPGTAAG